MILSEIEKSYISGLIDGEGSIFMEKNEKRYNIIINCSNTNKKIIYWLYSIFGGHVYTRKSKGNHKESYIWRIRKEASTNFLNQISPYLRVKKKQANLVYEFLTSDNKNKELIYHEIKKLNHRGAMN
jgi:hypothetical protein